MDVVRDKLIFCVSTELDIYFRREAYWSSGCWWTHTFKMSWVGPRHRKLNGCRDFASNMKPSIMNRLQRLMIGRKNCHREFSLRIHEEKGAFRLSVQTVDSKKLDTVWERLTTHQCFTGPISSTVFTASLAKSCTVWWLGWTLLYKWNDPSFLELPR